MGKRYLDCTASEIRRMNGKELADAIAGSEGRLLVCETIGAVRPMLGDVTNAEFAAAMGADLIILNLFDVHAPVIQGLPDTAPGTVPGITTEYIRRLVSCAHELGKLTLTAIGTLPGRGRYRHDPRDRAHVQDDRDGSASSGRLRLCWGWHCRKIFWNMKSVTGSPPYLSQDGLLYKPIKGQNKKALFSKQCLFLSVITRPSAALCRTPAEILSVFCFASGFRFVGTWIWTVTYWSPRTPGFFMETIPLPRRRILEPDCVPSRILHTTLP